MHCCSTWPVEAPQAAGLGFAPSIPALRSQPLLHLEAPVDPPRQHDTTVLFVIGFYYYYNSEKERNRQNPRSDSQTIQIKTRFTAGGTFQ